MRLSDAPQRRLSDQEVDQLATLANDAWEYFEPDFTAQIEAKDINASWATWSQANEGICLAWYDAKGDLDPDVDLNAYCGRGQAPRIKTKQAGAPSPSAARKQNHPSRRLVLPTPPPRRGSSTAPQVRSTPVGGS